MNLLASSFLSLKNVVPYLPEKNQKVRKRETYFIKDLCLYFPKKKFEKCQNLAPSGAQSVVFLYKWRAVIFHSDAFPQ